MLNDECGMWNCGSWNREQGKVNEKRGSVAKLRSVWSIRSVRSVSQSSTASSAVAKGSNAASLVLGGSR